MAGRVLTEAPKISSDRTNELHCMEQKIERAVELVEIAGFKTIPEPKVDV
jgi:hypothetical protein